MSITVYKETPPHYDMEEYCPHCDSMIPFAYDSVDDRDDACLETVCPICGNRLMICTLCEHSDENGDWIKDDCDWSEANGCHRDRAHTQEV